MLNVFHLNTTSHLCMPLGCLHTAQLRKYLHASKENLNPVKSCQLLRIIFFCVYVHKFLLLLPYPEYTITASLSWSIDPVLRLLFTQTDKMADYNSSNEWNFTAANNYSQLQDQTRCFSYIVYRKSAIEDFYITYVVSIIFNSICAVPACLLNLLVIIAVWKKQQLHTPSNVLLSNLALTDFGVGCIVQPLFVAHKIGAIQGNISLHCIASLASKTLASVLGVASLTTLTAISIDRLLALILNVRYRIVVTLRFTARTVGVLWILSIILTLPLFIYPLSFVYCMVLLGAICFAVTMFAYAKLLRLIQRQRCRVQTDLHAAQNNQATSQTQIAQHTQEIKYQCTNDAQHMQHPTEMINIAKYRSSTHTVVYLVLFMIIFYSPYLISNIVLAVTRTSDDRFKATFNITHTILFMNSLLNPLFHCWRMRNIRKAICEMFSDIMPE